ncbi:MAG: hypothetical protein ACI9C4_002050 [Paraglaciecola sp.]|jgi:hypothetical protein
MTFPVKKKPNIIYALFVLPRIKANSVSSAIIKRAPYKKSINYRQVYRYLSFLGLLFKAKNIDHVANNIGFLLATTFMAELYIDVVQTSCGILDVFNCENFEHQVTSKV